MNQNSHYMSLIREIKALERSEVGKEARQRMNDFASFKDKPTEQWFSELCFCLLTANAKFKTGFAIQQELGHQGLIHHPESELVNCIKRNKHRFHNTKAKYIVLARDHIDIKNKISKIIQTEGESAAREWLVKNIKGLGYKESSHFLRNTGAKDLAIVDRHILSVMKENNLIRQKPNTVTKKIYFKLEKKLQSLAKQLNLSMAELDLYLWYMKTNAILK